MITAERTRSYPTAWWGMVLLISTEATVFVILLSANFFVMAQAKQWPPPGIEAPELAMTTIFSVVLWASSVPVVWGESMLEKGRLGPFKVASAIAFVMGASFVVYSLYDFRQLHYGWRDNTYGSLYYTIVGLHLAHVCAGLAMSALVQAKAWTGRFDSGRHVSATVFALYWHFVDAVWVFVFPAMILAPHWVK